MSDPRIFHLLHKAHASLFKATNGVLRAEAGISTVQQAVLFFLDKSDGQPLSEIAQTLAMGKSSLSGLIDRMTDADLVARQQDPDDGRISRLYITDKGRALVARTKQFTKELNSNLLAPFDAQERQAVERFLHFIVDAADDITTNTLPTKIGDAPAGARQKSE